MTVKFIPRLTKPEKNNKYYIRKSNGGYSEAIQGSPTDKDCNVLSNCVGYAYGRFNEIGGFGSCKYLKPVNAENFMQYKGDLKSGMTAKVGACMVWQGGNTLSASDGAGHVAIVEKVISDTEVITSESAWGGSAFFTQTRKKGNGNWDEPNKKFLGFIYNPAELIVEGDKMYTVYQDIKGYNSAADAAARKNPTTVNKKGEYYMYHKYPNGYNGMYNITKNPNSAGSWINPADNKKPDDIETLKKENAELKTQLDSLKNTTKTLESKISAVKEILK